MKTIIKELLPVRRFTTILFIAIAALLTSCEGPMGPAGYDGYDGVDGEDGQDAEIGKVFDIQGNFTSDNEYRLYTEFPSNITVYESDVVLVYILWEQVDGLDVWRLCPQTVVLPEGVIQYNYDYTLGDVQVYLEFTVPEENLLPAETDNQVFRVAILPADFVAKNTIDVSDFNTILKAPEIELKQFDKIKLETIGVIN